MSELDDDTALVADGPGRFKGVLTDRWFIGTGLNGGYLMSALARAVTLSSGQPHPLTMSTHFVDRAQPGAITITVETVRAGRGHDTVTARMEQNSNPMAVTVATLGRRRDGGPAFVHLEPPPLDPPNQCEARAFDPPPEMTFLQRFEHRFPAGDVAQVRRGEPRDPVFTGWVRLRDRDVDDVAVPLIADCFPPPVFAALGGGFAPTLELTVHWRGEPEPGWLACRFESRALGGGYVEEDGEIWTATGRLVAQSRQLSRFIPPS